MGAAGATASWLAKERLRQIDSAHFKLATTLIRRQASRTKRVTRDVFAKAMP